MGARRLLYLLSAVPHHLSPPPHSQDAGGITRRAEAALLARISSEYSFPRALNSADAGAPGAADAAADAASSAILPLLAEHLELDLAKKDPEAWKAVRTVFERAHPWAVRSQRVVFHREINHAPTPPTIFVYLPFWCLRG